MKNKKDNEPKPTEVNSSIETFKINDLIEENLRLQNFITEQKLHHFEELEKLRDYFINEIMVLKNFYENQLKNLTQ